jgi:pimeloyl-ACP methyl ester carboxylesterase
MVIHNLATGDGSLAAAALVQAASPPNIVGYGLQFGVTCGEWMARTSGQRITDAGKAALPDFPEAVTSLPAQVPFVPTDCATWKMPTAAPSASRPTASDVPVLIGAGTFDSATPPAYAAEATRTLPNAVNLTFPGAGHGLASDPASKDCFTKVMANFLDQPVGFDHSCVQTLQIPAFTTG